MEKNENIILGGDKSQYYSCKGQLYTGTFPVDWALNHISKTGPAECPNCAYFGSWNGVFIGYCANCALDKYNGERGRGFIGLGKETKSKKIPSVFENYLKGISLDEIGDKKIMDSGNILMIEEINAYADILFNQVTDKPHFYERYDEKMYGSNLNGGYDSY
jgi:hypothetical protein